MFFSKKKIEKIDEIKSNFLKKKPILRSISIYADNKKINISNIYVLRTYKEIYDNFLSLKTKGENNYLLENFSNIDDPFLVRKYDIILVKIDFKIISLISEDKTTQKMVVSNRTPTNVWVLKKGSIDFYDLESKKILSNKMMLSN